MAENLKIKFDEKEPKIALAIVSDGKRAATQMQGSVLDLLHAYGDLTVKLRNSFVEHGIGELEAADMLQAGIRACAQVEKVNLDGMFSGGNDAVLYVTWKDEEHLACGINQEADDARICTALTCAIGGVKERLESKCGEKFAKYLLFKVYCIAVGEIDPHEEMKGEE
jgi:hypothetical protein